MKTVFFLLIFSCLCSYAEENSFEKMYDEIMKKRSRISQTLHELKIEPVERRSSHEEMYHKFINELNQFPDVKQFKEELEKAEEGVFRSREEWEQAKFNESKSADANDKYDDDYFSKLEMLINQHSNGLVSLWSRVSNEYIDTKNAYEEAVKELLIERFPIGRQYFEAEENLSEIKSKKRRIKKLYYGALTILREHSIEAQFLESEYNQAKDEYFTALRKLREHPPKEGFAKGLKEYLRMEERKPSYSVRRYKARGYRVYTYPDDIGINEKGNSPEGERLLAEHLPEVWSLRLRYKQASREYQQFLDELKQHPEVLRIQALWNVAPNTSIEREKLGELKREYNIVFKEVGKLPEVEDLREEYEEKSEEYEKIGEKYRSLFILAERSPEIQNVKKRKIQAEEEYDKAHDEERKAKVRYDQALYEYNTAKYKHYKALEIRQGELLTKLLE